MSERSQTLGRDAVRDAAPAYHVEPLEVVLDGVPPGYKRTEAGVIPEDWEYANLGKITDLLTGFPFASSRFSPSGVVLVRGSNVKRGELDWDEDITRYWKTVTPEIARYQLEEGDLVVAMDGALVGRSFAVISRTDLPALLVQRVARLRTSHIDQRLIACWVASESFVEYVDSVKTHTAIPHISPSDIRAFDFAFPTNSKEQQAIASALSDAGALIESLDRLIAKKRAIKQAAMQQLLTGQTRLPGFAGEWEAKRLGEIAPLQRGFDLPTSRREAGPYPVVYSNGVWEYHSKPMVRGPGVVTGRSGTLGRIHYVEQDYWPHNTTLWVTDFCSNDPRFIFYFYQWLGFERFASGSGVPTLNRNDAHSYQAFLPSCVPEQTAIATVLSDMDAEIEALERRRDKARQIRQGMMQQLLTGKVRLIDPACEERINV